MTGPALFTSVAGRSAALMGCVLFAASCATTTVDDGDGDGGLTDQELTGGPDREIAADNTTPLDGGVIVDDNAPDTTVAVVGSAAELLPEIGIDMSRLSAEIGDDGDEDATLARIQANWAAIRDEIERDRPELLSGIETTIEMAVTAVERNRPADGDKAFSLLNDLIDAFTGDG